MSPRDIDSQRSRLLFCLAVVTAASVTLLGNQAPIRPHWANAADAELSGPTADPLSADDLEHLVDAPPDEDSDATSPQQPALNLFELILKGRWLMVPIGLLSLLVVAIGFERALALRQRRVMPAGLIEELGKLGNHPDGFDPRKAYQICQRFPSAASDVVRTMLIKVGRPQSEVEHTVKESSEREAERLYANVRWLNLTATIAPLLGLLGTVWGMIQAFFDTTQLDPGQNKADFLAKGIYVALVTTLGGLSVAIPAATLAHFFEGRIRTIFHQIDEMLFNLMPQIERFEGRLRVTRQKVEDEPSRLVTPSSAEDG